MLHHDGADPTSVIPAIRAFHARRHLTDEEITALWPLVVLRGATLVLSGRAQVRLDDANEYAADALDRERRIFDVATSVPASVMTAAIRSALEPGRAAPTRTWEGAPLFTLPAEVVVLDAGTVSPLNDRGAWLDPEELDPRVQSHAMVLSNTGGVCVQNHSRRRGTAESFSSPCPSAPS